MKKPIALFLALVFATSSWAANTKPIEDVFQRYWNAFAKKDFTKAAADVLPSDLEEIKTVLVPALIAASTSKEKEVQEFVATFFGKTVGKSREMIPPAEAFAGLMRVMTAGNPQLFDIPKEASTTVVFVRTPDADNADVHFQISVRGQGDMDVEPLTRKNGRWWVKLKEDPKELAAQIKAMAEKKP